MTVLARHKKSCGSTAIRSTHPSRDHDPINRESLLRIENWSTSRASQPPAPAVRHSSRLRWTWTSCVLAVKLSHGQLPPRCHVLPALDLSDSPALSRRRLCSGPPAHASRFCLARRARRCQQTGRSFSASFATVSELAASTRLCQLSVQHAVEAEPE